LEEKKRRNEAESLLRGYRSHYCADDSLSGLQVIPNSPSKVGKSGGRPMENVDGSAADVSMISINNGTNYKVVEGTVMEGVGKFEELDKCSINSSESHQNDQRQEGSESSVCVSNVSVAELVSIVDEKHGKNSSNNPDVRCEEIEEKEQEEKKEFQEITSPIELDELHLSSKVPKECSSKIETVDNDLFPNNSHEFIDLIVPDKCGDGYSNVVANDDKDNNNDNENENSTIEAEQNVVEEAKGKEDQDEILEELPKDCNAKVEVGEGEERKQKQKVTPLDDKANTHCSLDWRDWISNESGAKFRPEVGRYHLYLSHACPFAHRTAIVLALKGLQNVIGVTYVHPTWQFTKHGVDEHRGWVFGSIDGKALSNTNGYGSFPSSWGEEDPHNGAYSIRELYEKTNDKHKKYTVPVLWDTKLRTIVNNNSADIMRILNSEFNDFTASPLNLYPDDIASEIDCVNDWVYCTLTDGVFCCGLAESQEAYETAIDGVTSAFDKVESILQQQRYIVGEKLTQADIRLFVTLLQFDEIYSVYFKANTRSVSSCPTILKYVREIFNMEGVAKTCDMAMIKAHYYTSHVELNKYSIIPKGEDFFELLSPSATD